MSADQRVDQVVDQAVDDRGEGGADDDADREVHHVAAGDEVAEFLDHAVLSLSRFRVSDLRPRAVAGNRRRSGAQGAAGRLRDARRPPARDRLDLGVGQGGGRSAAGGRRSPATSCPAPICASALGPAKTSKTLTVVDQRLVGGAGRLEHGLGLDAARRARRRSRARPAGRSEATSGGRVVPRALGKGSASRSRVKATAGPRTSSAARMRGWSSPKVASGGLRAEREDAGAAGVEPAGGGALEHQRRRRADRGERRLGVGAGVPEVDRAAGAVRVARRGGAGAEAGRRAAPARRARRRGRPGRSRRARGRRSRGPGCGRRRAAGRAAGRGAGGSSPS